MTAPAPSAVYIRSLAYAGTTWINMVLGGHPRAFALGVPDRIWQTSAAEAGRLCSVHGVQCPFWPRYYQDPEPAEDVVSRIARLSGRDVVIMNNIGMNLLNEEVIGRGVPLKYIVVLRDGRANVTSALRHTPELFTSRYHAIQTWLKPAWTHLFNGIPDDPARRLVLKYEDMVADPLRELARVGAFLGLEYGPDALRFWAHDHHPIGGNTGTLGLLRDLRGERRASHAREDYYQELAEATRREPERPRLDESWREILSRDDLVAYDYLVGPLHAAFGYPRDAISPEELAAFRARHGLPEDAGASPLEIDAPLPPMAGAGVTELSPRWWSRLAAQIVRRVCP